MSGEEPKKDLTSIVDLAAMQGDDAAAVGATPAEKATAEDFGNLEDLSSPEAAGEAMPSFLDDHTDEAPSILVEPEPPTATPIVAREIPAEPSATLDPDQAPLQAPPAGADHAIKSSEAPTAKQDLSAVKQFADKLAIGKPRIEGAPAFSLLARNDSGHFDEKTIQAIEDALTSEDFGIRVDDVRVQLSTGKLLVPQISEFAAVTLAQKLRDVVDTIDVDLAAEIFKSSASELSSLSDSYFADTEAFQSHHEEVHDIGAEPGSESDLFTTNLPALADYQVTRVLSIVIASDILEPAVAENPSSKAFEGATEKITHELTHRAYKLGAHGVLGINFTLKAIEIYKDSTGKMGRAYRLLGTGTAVRVKAKAQQLPNT